MTAERCAEVLARILLDDTTKPRLALRAVELFFRMTTGFAPTREARFTAKLSATRFLEERAAIVAGNSPVPR